jgi:hypothetical protein
MAISHATLDNQFSSDELTEHLPADLGALLDEYSRIAQEALKIQEQDSSSNYTVQDIQDLSRRSNETTTKFKVSLMSMGKTANQETLYHTASLLSKIIGQEQNKLQGWQIDHLQPNRVYASLLRLYAVSERTKKIIENMSKLNDVTEFIPMLQEMRHTTLLHTQSPPILGLHTALGHITSTEKYLQSAAKKMTEQNVTGQDITILGGE